MFNFMRLPPLRRLMLMKAITGGGSWSTITGNPVSFTAKAAPLRQLSVAFSPVQNLNGYDSPWPAGGHYNQWDEEWEVGGVSSSDGQNVQQNNIRSKNYIPVTAEAEYYVLIGTSSDNKAYLFYYDSNKAYIGNSSGYVRGAVTIPSGVAYLRFQCNANYGYSGYNNDIAINYPSSVTTYSPYSNLCPISGWDSLTVEQRGKNLTDPSNLVQGFINASGVVVTGATNRVAYDEYICVKGISNIVCSNSAGLQYTVFGYNDNKGAMYGGSWKESGVTTDVAALSWIKLTFRDANNADITPSDVTEVMTVYGTTASPYQPYNPSSRSISISIGSTVYSGYVDVVTGVGEVTSASFDMGTKTWARAQLGSAGHYFFYYGLYDESPFPKFHGDTFCEILTGYDGTTPQWDYPDNSAFISNSAVYPVLYIRCDTYADAATFKTAMSGVMLVYELATPILISLTPQEVQSLAGDNVVWSTANGDLTVEYRSN